MYNSEHMNWNITAHGITGEIKFSDQTELAEFVLKLAKISDNIAHHADMVISYNTLLLTVFTHDQQSVTEKDHDLCREIEKLLN